MRSMKQFTVVLLTLLLAVSSSPPASAATYEFTATVKKAFDKMTAAADRATAAKLKNQYEDLKTLQKQDQEWDRKINGLYSRNKEAAILTRKRIKEIDAAAINRLEEEVKGTKERYRPLFSLYKSLNEQMKIAKSLKNKEMAALLRPQIENVKVAVRLAKHDIRAKEEMLKSAKASRTKKMKRVRLILAGINPVKVKIKSAKSAVSSAKKQFAAETKILNQAVRKGDAAGSLRSFARLNAFKRQIIEQKSKIYSYEQQIGEIITRAESEMPAR